MSMTASTSDHRTTTGSSWVLDLQGEDYYDRVYGCWQGKNAGGTLGTPLEKAYGEPEPFDVWWYPELKEGGLPNDDLEMQLAWLKAAEEVGPTLTARDMARYWLDHIGYNFDEYGLSKANLKLGLEPPVSGRYNNWFIHCMGSPIRSEIWACISPGAPRVAARFAINDAICDHAGGEGVYGEVFNAVLESAAFVVQEPLLLIDIALGYIPADSESAKAVHAVLAAVEAGLDWKQARQKVLEATPHYVAQYSPINLGFQVIGLLYGTDFGDGICKTVNCGYDTDSSGAAIGSYLGVILGSKALPQKWVAPLGNTIATNESWGGVKHLSQSQRPVPETLEELVERIRVTAIRVLQHHDLLDQDGKLRLVVDDLRADEDFAAELADSSTMVSFPGTDVDVQLEYGQSPVIHPDRSRSVITHLRNVREERLEIEAGLAVPPDWPTVTGQTLTLEPGETRALEWTVGPVPRSAIDNTNRVRLDIALTDRPTPAPVPFVLVGAHAFRVSVVPHPGGDDLAALEATPVPGGVGLDRAGEWRDHSVDGFDAELERVVDAPAVLHLQAFWWAPEAQHVRLGFDTSSVSRLLLNGEVIHTVTEATPIRPSLNASKGSTTGADLRRGWNELLLTVVRGSAPLDSQLLLCTDNKMRDTLPAIGRTRLPA